jgi:hypothetical protein
MTKMCLIKNFPNRAFAEQAKQVLLDNDVPCVVKSADAGILGTTTASLLHGANLYVEEKYQQKAADLLNALFNGI